MQVNTRFKKKGEKNMRKFTTNPIVNIARAEIVTEEANPRVMFFETVSSAKPEPFVSEGDDKELRVRNTILAQHLLEDIIKGYNIKLTDCVLSKELLEVVDGGISNDAGTGEFEGYRSPVAGVESKRTRFTLRFYTAEKDYGGDAVAYFRFSFPNCVGTPANFSFEEGSFTTPEYTIKSRPPYGKSAMTVECLDSLPVYCASADELPKFPEAGCCIVATAGFKNGDITLSAGDMMYYNGTAYEKIV